MVSPTGFAKIKPHASALRFALGQVVFFCSSFAFFDRLIFCKKLKTNALTIKSLHLTVFFVPPRGTNIG